MSFRDFLIRKLGGQPTPPQRVHTIAASPRLPLRNKQLAPGIRIGSWVRWEGRTGIAQPGPDGLVEVHVVNDAGETILVTHQPWGAMRKATMSEIPESRRQGKKLAALRRLGYAED